MSYDTRFYSVSQYSQINRESVSTLSIKPIKDFQFRSKESFNSNPQVTVFNKEDIKINGELDRTNIDLKLSELRSLLENWNGENTFPPNDFAFSLAEKFIHSYENYVKDYCLNPAYIYIAPLNSGGIQLEFSAELYSLEIYIYNNCHDSFSYLLTDDNLFYKEDTILFKNENNYNNSIESLFRKLHQL